MDHATQEYLIFETAGGFCGIAWNGLRGRLSRSPNATSYLNGSSGWLPCKRVSRLMRVIGT